MNGLLRCSVPLFLALLFWSCRSNPLTMGPAIFEEMGVGFDSIKNPKHRLWLHSEGFALMRGSGVVLCGSWEGGSDMGCILYPKPVPKGKKAEDVALVGGLRDGMLELRNYGAAYNDPTVVRYRLKLVQWL